MMQEAMENPGPDCRPGVLDEAVANLDDQLSRLTNYIDGLESRLHGVLRPEEPSSTLDGAVSEMAAPRAPLVHNIEGSARQVRRQSDRIERLIDRLDT